MNKRFLLIFVSALMGGLATPAQAQSDWPSKPVRLIVPYSAGGPVDQIARAIQQPLSDALGQSVIIENRDGASGTIGMDAAIKSKPDGYTFGFGVPGGITVLPHLRKLPYDVNQINYVSLVARVPQVLTVSPKLPVNSLKELIALAKKEDGKLNYGSSGIATTQHLGAALLAQETGTKMTHIAYKGAAPAVTALLAGEVQMMAADLPAVRAYLASGVKVLAVSSSRRTELMPDVPSTAELGLSGLVVESNYGIIAPQGLPAPIFDKMHQALVAVLGKPEVKERLAGLGAVAVSTTPDEYRKLMESESLRWGGLLTKAGIRLD